MHICIISMFSFKKSKIYITGRKERKREERVRHCLHEISLVLVDSGRDIEVYICSDLLSIKRLSWHWVFQGCVCSWQQLVRGGRALWSPDIHMRSSNVSSFSGWKRNKKQKQLMLYVWMWRLICMWMRVKSLQRSDIHQEHNWEESLKPKDEVHNMSN